MFSLIQNIVAVSKDRKTWAGGSVEDLEARLLTGKAFKDCAHIDGGSLNDIYDALRGVSRGSSYIPAPLKDKNKGGGDIEKKRKETAKISRALDRLKKAYLFDDDTMDEREYMTTRASLEEDLTRLNNEIADSEEAAFVNVSELSFVTSASEFLLSYKIQSDEEIVYSDFAPLVGDEALRKFVTLLISRVDMQKGRVVGVVFANGLEIRFIYK